MMRAAPAGQCAQVRSGTELLTLLREPMIHWHALGLDPAVNDDRLLATIIEFANQHAGLHVCFVSDDFLAGQKAESRGIRLVEPEGLIDRIERSDTDETASLGQRAVAPTPKPDVHLDFWDEGTITQFIRRSASTEKEGWPTDEQIAQRVTQKQQRLEHIIATAHGHAKPQELTAFRKQYTAYLELLERALRMERVRTYGRRCEIAFVLRNEGSAPAIYVDIKLVFPRESFVVGMNSEDDSFWNNVLLPNEPQPPWTLSYFERYNSFLLGSSLQRPPEAPRPRGPLYDPDKCYKVRYNHPKLRAKEVWRMEPVLIYLPPMVSGGFQIACSMHADSLPEPVAKHLNVQLM